jgi:hypothetical protein
MYFETVLNGGLVIGLAGQQVFFERACWSSFVAFKTI